ncbi:putative DNA polymerase B [Stenotrophomonas phage vB_SmaS_BUCT548]|uniref:Putative DNA polymerase B n=1 Tax=Stenotrophomonas phage vB_SmaS_BUCT548 TaxID=2712941 RepID=A0A7D2LFT0_9CAUD|nr:putative DNA polymerase B [Stenotrophomonas phage vB_SmaS_BUCT548]QIQ60757.1 putative DNA polymerase B [Stenotrophomonas phage vB_SmaS_BUCT548]
MGLFFETPQRKKTVKTQPPEPVWLRDDYLPNLEEARTLKDVSFLPEAELWMSKAPLIFDIEVMPNYVEFGFMDDDTGRVYVEESSVTEDDPFCKNINWDKLEWVMKNRLTIGFNSKGFDLPVALVGLHHRRIEAMREATKMLIEDDMRVHEVLAHFGIDPNQLDMFDHIDLIEVAPLDGSLKIYAGRIMIENMMDLPFLPNRWLSSDHKSIIRYYNIARDLPSTRALFNVLKPQMELRVKMSAEYGIDLRSKSDAQIAEHVIKHELRKILGKVPKRAEIPAGTRYKYEAPDYLQFTYGPFINAFNTIKNADFYITESGGFEMPQEIADLVLELNGLGFTMGLGGLHSTESCAAHKDDGEYQLWDFDVTSYYPSIILLLKLFPPKLGEAFLHVYRKLVNDRVNAKKNHQTIIADSLKIVINGSFGKLGSKWSSLYAPLLMIIVTITGQLSLLMLIDMLNQVGIRTVSANTDGVVMKPHNSQIADMHATIKEWERRTKYQMEGTRYMGLYSRDVNNYFAVKAKFCKEKGDFIREVDGAKTKGAYYNALSSKNASDQLKKNPTNIIVSEAVEAYLTTGKWVRETIEECDDIRKFVTVRSVKGGAVYLTNYDPPKHASKMALIEQAGFIVSSENGMITHPDFMQDGFPSMVFTLNDAYDRAFKALSSHDTEYLGKSIRWYQAKAALGSLVNASSGHAVPDSEGAKPLMSLPKSLPWDLDKEWYVARAERVLKEIGIVLD